MRPYFFDKVENWTTPNMINSAVPDGAPPRRFKNVDVQIHKTPEKLSDPAVPREGLEAGDSHKYYFFLERSEQGGRARKMMVRS